MTTFSTLPESSSCLVRLVDLIGIIIRRLVEGIYTKEQHGGKRRRQCTKSILNQYINRASLPRSPSNRASCRARIMLKVEQIGHVDTSINASSREGARGRRKGEMALTNTKYKSKLRHEKPKTTTLIWEKVTKLPYHSCQTYFGLSSWLYDGLGSYLCKTSFTCTPCPSAPTRSFLPMTSIAVSSITRRSTASVYTLDDA